MYARGGIDSEIEDRHWRGTRDPMVLCQQGLYACRPGHTGGKIHHLFVHIQQGYSIRSSNS